MLSTEALTGIVGNPDTCPASTVSGVHIHFCGNDGWRFRSYSESLWKSPKVTKGLLPLSFGASPRLGIPSLRSCSVGPPPSAIHGRGRLTRHPCRVAHCAEPPLGLTRGRAPQKQKRGGLPAGLTSSERVPYRICRRLRSFDLAFAFAFALLWFLILI
jgi:hypothetical protein